MIFSAATISISATVDDSNTFFTCNVRYKFVLQMPVLDSQKRTCHLVRYGARCSSFAGLIQHPLSASTRSELGLSNHSLKRTVGEYY